MVEFVSGSIMIRVMGDGEGLKKGEIVGGHTHAFDHTSIFFCGNWHVKKWEPDGTLSHDFEREGPFHVLIEAKLPARVHLPRRRAGRLGLLRLLAPHASRRGEHRRDGLDEGLRGDVAAA